MSFSDVVETIKELSFEEKQEINLLLSQYLREEKRNQIYQSYQESQLEIEQGKSQFSSNINQLKQLLEEE